jgi:hypothetical protein
MVIFHRFLLTFTRGYQEVNEKLTKTGETKGHPPDQKTLCSIKKDPTIPCSSPGPGPGLVTRKGGLAGAV